MGAGREMLISLDNVRDKNMMQLKKINTALFPIRYNDKYYSDALASADFTKLGSFSLLGYFDTSFQHYAIILVIDTIEGKPICLHCFTSMLMVGQRDSKGRCQMKSVCSGTTQD